MKLWNNEAPIDSKLLTVGVQNSHAACSSHVFAQHFRQQIWTNQIAHMSGLEDSLRFDHYALQDSMTFAEVRQGRIDAERPFGAVPHKTIFHPENQIHNLNTCVRSWNDANLVTKPELYSWMFQGVEVC